MKNEIISWLILIIFVALGIFVYVYGTRPAMPKIEADGRISGNYSIASIMRVGLPYKCTFEKTDGPSKILGVLHTDGNNIYGEFRIRTDLTENQFNSFLLVKKNDAYIWTSLKPTGYKSSAVQSASKGASIQDQAQIVGTRDKMMYECELLQNLDSTIFEIPECIAFVDLK